MALRAATAGTTPKELIAAWSDSEEEAKAMINRMDAMSAQQLEAAQGNGAE